MKLQEIEKNLIHQDVNRLISSQDKKELRNYLLHQDAQ